MLKNMDNDTIIEKLKDIKLLDLIENTISELSSRSVYLISKYEGKVPIEGIYRSADYFDERVRTEMNPLTMIPEMLELDGIKNTMTLGEYQKKEPEYCNALLGSIYFATNQLGICLDNLVA